MNFVIQLGKMVAMFRRIALAIPLALFLPIIAEPAFEFRPIGARVGGMEDTFAGMAEGAEVLFWNPASITWLPGIDATAGYDRPFGMKELQTQAFGVLFGTGVGAAGLSYQSYGY